LKWVLIILIFLPFIEGRVYYGQNEIRIAENHSIDDLNEILPTDYFEIKEGGVCYLKKPLFVNSQSHLDVHGGGDCTELRLYYNAKIKISGSAEFKDIKVTSYDPSTGKPIEITKETYDRQRPYIYADIPAEFVNIVNSEISHLGYYNPQEEGSAWGIAFWHLKRVVVENSNIHHNYFGLYTWDVNNAVIRNNEMHDNLEYGLDFHDYSNNFIVQRNEVYNNGNHAIIFSRNCDNNKVIDNHVYNNSGLAFVKGEQKDYGTHGIVLHENSSNNLIQGNILENNRGAIRVIDSSKNIIRDNFVLSDLEDGIYLDKSFSNVVTGNTIENTIGRALYSYYSDSNLFSGNFFQNGTYFKGEVEGKPYAIYNNATEADEAFLQAEIQKIISETSGSSDETDFLKDTLDGPLNFKIYFISGLIATVTLVFLFEGIFKFIRRKNEPPYE
jgi:parallel beta-helix repeat protein